MYVVDTNIGALNCLSGLHNVYVDCILAQYVHVHVDAHAYSSVHAFRSVCNVIVTKTIFIILLNVLPCVLHVHNRTFPYATEIQNSGVRMFAIGVTQGIIEENVRNLSSPQVISSSSTFSSITCMTAIS